MTETGFHMLPNETILQIGSNNDDSSLLSLLLCSCGLSALLLPVLHTRAFAHRGGRPAIEWAAAHGHITLVNLLLVNGVHPDTGATDTEPPALLEAVRASNSAIVELFIAHGANVNRLNYDHNYGYETVAYSAAAKGDAGIVQQLAAHGADVDSEKDFGMYTGTPLHEAVRNGHVAVVKALLDLSVRVNEEDSNCETPLEIAERLACTGCAIQGQRASMAAMVELLVKAGAHV